MHALQSHPECLRAWLIRLPNDVASQRGDHFDHFVESRRFPRWLLAMDGHVNRFPFTRFEHNFAAHARTLTTEATKIEDFPGNDRIRGKAIQEGVDRLKVALFNPASGLQRLEIDFDLPTNFVVVDDQLNLFARVDRQRCDQPAT